MSNYAVVDSNGNVINICVWDGVSLWSPPEGTTAVLCDDEPNAESGGTYINGVFARAVVDVPVAEPDPTLEEKIAALQAQLAELASQVSS
jgi:hypothetical protein